MKCLIKNRECPHASRMKRYGCSELGEKEGFFEYTICYNDEIEEDTECPYGEFEGD